MSLFHAQLCVQTTFLHMKKDIEIDKPSYSCDESAMHNDNL